MIRFLASDPGPPPKHWSADEWDILARLRRQRKVLLADAQVGPEQATADLVRSAGGLEDMPLIAVRELVTEIRRGHADSPFRREDRD